MSRLDAVVRVLKATGKALHYDVITRQALHQGIIRFTGSQGTAGESMKVSCACMFVRVDVWAHIKGRAVHKFENTRHHMYVSNRQIYTKRDQSFVFHTRGSSEILTYRGFIGQIGHTRGLSEIPR